MTEEKKLKEVTVYTDGSCRGNPGPGGWGAYLVYGEHRRELYGGDPETTNNKMELKAVAEALNALKFPCRVILHTDSKYVQQGITDWIKNWKAKNWRTAGGQPVKNREYWEALDKAAARHEVVWQWVKGHAGDPGNEKADELANRGADEASGKP